DYAPKDTKLFYGRDELVKLNRFHHVGVGTQGVALGQIPLLARRCEHDDGNRFQVDVTLNRPQNFEPINLRHFEVEEHDHGIPLLPGGKDATAIEVVEHFRPVTTYHDLVGNVMFFHGGQRKLGITRVIFREKNGFHRGHLRDLASGSEK